MLRSKPAARAWLIALAASLLGAAPASAAWTAPVTVSPFGNPNEVGSVEVGIDGGGNAEMAMRQSASGTNRIVLRRRQADGSLLPQTVVWSSSDATSDPQLAIAQTGEGAVIWQVNDGTGWRLLARPLAANGAPGPTRTLSADSVNSLDPGVAMNPAGGAEVTWVSNDGTTSRVQTRSLSSAGDAGPTQTLSSNASGAIRPHAAFDSSGNALFVWQVPSGDEFRVLSRSRSSGGTLGSTQTISGDVGAGTQLRMTPSGDAVVTWAAASGISYRAQARARSAAGTWSSVQSLSTADLPEQDVQQASSPSGTTLIAWGTFEGRVQVRSRAADGSLTATQTVTPAGVDATMPVVGVDTNDDAVIAWKAADDTREWVEARQRASDGSLTPILSLSTRGALPGPIRMARALSGPAIVAYVKNHEGFNQAEFVFGP